MTGPLHGVNIIEFEGIGPGPLCGRMLAGMGAHVTVIARPSANQLLAQLGDIGQEFSRGKTRIVLDLKDPAHREQAFSLACGADALIEGNRPGVMERLGLGPADLAQHNPRLVYGRMTGWGQGGPLAQVAGHDLNYAALTGALALSAHRGGMPILPPTVLGDGAGALGLAFGIACALFEVRRTGRGKVVDAAIVDIVAMLGGISQCAVAAGQLGGDEAGIFHDSPFYDVYRCAGGGFITIGALEPQFYALLLEKLELTDVDPAAQFDRTAWPALKERLHALFLQRTKASWCELLEGTDTCFAPVLSLAEAAQHPHNLARSNFSTTASGAFFGNTAPRFRDLA